MVTVPGLRRSAAAAGIGLAVACTPTQRPAPTEDAPPPDDAPAVLQPVVFDGDCTAAPDMGALSAYGGASATLVRNSIGVRVRACAVWPADDLRNLLGILESGQRVPVFGPVKHGPFSAGIGYVVPLVDERGARCRGYVSATVLDRVDVHPTVDVGDALPLPDARPAWTGPCLPAEPEPFE